MSKIFSLYNKLIIKFTDAITCSIHSYTITFFQCHTIQLFRTMISRKFFTFLSVLNKIQNFRFEDKIQEQCHLIEWLNTTDLAILTYNRCRKPRNPSRFSWILLRPIIPLSLSFLGLITTCLTRLSSFGWCIEMSLFCCSLSNDYYPFIFEFDIT
jgi:hypothetical protein